MTELLFYWTVTLLNCYFTEFLAFLKVRNSEVSHPNFLWQQDFLQLGLIRAICDKCGVWKKRWQNCKRILGELGCQSPKSGAELYHIRNPRTSCVPFLDPTRASKNFEKSDYSTLGPAQKTATPMNNMTIWLELDCHHPSAAGLPQTNLLVAFKVKKCFPPRNLHFWGWVFWRSIKYHRVTKQHPKVLPTPFSSVKPPSGSINATLRGRDHHAVSSGSLFCWSIVLLSEDVRLKHTKHFSWLKYL